MNPVRLLALAASISSVALLAACASDDHPASADASESEDASSGKVTFTSIDTPHPVDVSGVTVIRSGAQYQQFFGQAAPKNVSFNKSWIVYASQGTRPTGGFAEAITSITKTGSGADRTLVVEVKETRPGNGCPVAQHVSIPAAAVLINKQNDTHGVEEVQDEVVTDCGQGSGVACGANTCGDGEKCCSASCGICGPVKGLCPAIVCGGPVDPPAGEKCGDTTCGADEQCCSASCGICGPKGGFCPAIECAPKPQTCGGIAGIACPKGQTCVDDPSDGCDPKHGGADCGGICQ